MQIAEIPLKGVTREMADNVSANGDLELAVNVVNDGQGLEMAEKPSVIFDLNGESLLLIHKTATYWHYITLKNGKLYYVNADTETGAVSVTTRTEIAAVNGDITTSQTLGNTIIFNDADGVHYILWKDSAYIDLGQKPPFINIQFGLDSEFVCYPPADADPFAIAGKPYRDQVALPWWCQSTYNEFVPPTQAEIDAARAAAYLTPTKYSTAFSAGSFSLENTYATDAESGAETSKLAEQFTTAVMAYVNKFVADKTDEEKFIFPFFIRYAYEMYDGSYVMHSYPVLMIPNSRGPVFALDGKEGLQLTFIDHSGDAYDKTGFLLQGRVYSFVSKLQYWIESGANDHTLDDWKDLIKNISVFVTAPLYDYEQGGKVYGWKNMVNDLDSSPYFNYNKWNDYYSIAKMNPQVNNEADDLNYRVQKFERVFIQRMLDRTPQSSAGHKAFTCWPDGLSDDQTPVYKLPSYIMSLPEIPEEQRRKRLVEDGVFYRICTLPIDDLTRNFDKYYLPLEDAVLQTLTTQPQLTDDFYTHDITHSDVSMIYNRRLNLAEVSRTPHDALPPFTDWIKQESSTGSTYRWDGRVFIKDKDGDIIVPFTDGLRNNYKVYQNCFVIHADEPAYDSTKPITQSLTQNYNIMAYEVKPGDVIKISMLQQEGYMTCAAFMSGSIYESNPTIDDADYQPTVLQVISKVNYSTPTDAELTATAPASTTLLVICTRKTATVNVYNLSLFDSDTSFPKYIFYPNPNAYKVQLHKWDKATPSQLDEYYEVPLQQHTALNGAFWLDTLLSSKTPTTITAAKYEDVNVRDIRYDGELIASEAENPFVFLPRNVNKIGEGTILSLCAAVAPLSEGQFGQFPLYAFTTEGVWALTIGTTGEVSSIQPVTRDVILHGTTPLSLDQSVVFMTSRGVMLLSGRHTKELSKVLAGKYYNRLSPQLARLLTHELASDDALITLPDTIAEDKIAAPALFAYDYLNSRIYVTLIDEPYSWVYNLKSGLWTQSQTHITGMVNSYPDCIFTQDGNAVRLSDDNYYDKGIILTRPLKFAKQGLQKLRELALRGYTLPDNIVTMLCGTRNWKDYGVVRASQGARLSRMGGSPYDAHSIAALITDDDEAVITHVSTTYDIEQANRLR